MTQPADASIRLRHSTAYFRMFEGRPELLIENGSDDGPCYVVGRDELQAVAEQIQLFLHHNPILEGTP